MLIEVKVKVGRIIDGKTRKRTEVYVIDKEFFSEAEYAVMQSLSTEVDEGLVEAFDVQSLKQSALKEICEQWYEDYTQRGYPSFIATMRDLFHDDEGNEKQLKYKVLLWAENLTAANRRALELSHQGYDMLIEGIKQVDYTYLVENDANGEGDTETV